MYTLEEYSYPIIAKKNEYLTEYTGEKRFVYEGKKTRTSSPTFDFNQMSRKCDKTSSVFLSQSMLPYFTEFPKRFVVFELDFVVLFLERKYFALSSVISQNAIS